MTSVRARFGMLVAFALMAFLVPTSTSEAATLPLSAPAFVLESFAPAAAPEPLASTGGARPSAVPVRVAPTRVAGLAVPAVSRSGRVALSRSVMRSALIRGKVIVAIASRYRGVRYVAGGSTPGRGFDCSGYTRYVFSMIGVHLPRVSSGQYGSMIKISRSQALPGDLVYFHSKNGHVYHVGIYAGGNRVWHAPYPGQRVKLERIWSSSIYVARLRV